MKALSECQFDGQRFPAVIIDCVDYAGETMIVAMGITGTKRILGLPQRATENAAVCAELLEDVRERRDDSQRSTLQCRR